MASDIVFGLLGLAVGLFTLFLLLAGASALIRSFASSFDDVKSVQQFIGVVIGIAIVVLTIYLSYN